VKNRNVTLEELKKDFESEFSKLDANSKTIVRPILDRMYNEWNRTTKMIEELQASTKEKNSSEEDTDS
jgi:hypothetical protein